MVSGRKRWLAEQAKKNTQGLTQAELDNLKTAASGLPDRSALPRSEDVPGGPTKKGGPGKHVWVDEETPVSRAREERRPKRGL